MQIGLSQPKPIKKRNEMNKHACLDGEGSQYIFFICSFVAN